MKKYFAVIGIFAGLIVALYLGVWYCFIGGLFDVFTQFANAFNGVQVNAIGIVWGIVKMLMAGLAFQIAIAIFWIPSFVALDVDVAEHIKRLFKYNKRKKWGKNA